MIVPSQPHARRAAAFFERFQASDVDALGDIYSDDAAFKDPFNDVQGLASIQRVYRHMFETLEDPRFTVWRCTPGDGDCWLGWRFSFGTGSATRIVKGASHLEFAPDGRIQSHRDYWDPAEELYLDVPVLGWIMRTVRRRLAAPQPY